MSNNVYCSMVHGGLNINLKAPQPFVQHCCLRTQTIPIVDSRSVWNNALLLPLREKNLSGAWDTDCANCKSLEQSGLVSFRQGMNQGLGMYGQTDLSGPARIDIMFDISCNLACRTCGPESSTFWQKHLKEHGQWQGTVYSDRKKNDIIELLSGLNLENLKQVVFCGGETLLGQEYWDVADWLATHVPNAKDQLTICFQTNGTQPIADRNFAVIDKVHLVKLHVSIDGIGAQFEYLRWPASWNQVQENLLSMKQKVPSNVMFLIEQTISVFNVLDIDLLDQWIEQNFTTNREGDPVECTKHLAHGIFNLRNASRELVEKLQFKQTKNLISKNLVENPVQIQSMIARIKKFDGYRNQSFEKTFPEVADAYRRFL